MRLWLQPPIFPVLSCHSANVQSQYYSDGLIWQPPLDNLYMHFFFVAQHAQSLVSGEWFAPNNKLSCLSAHSSLQIWHKVWCISFELVRVATPIRSQVEAM